MHTHFDSQSVAHGFLYAHGVFTTIDVLLPDVANTLVLGINDRGDLVGQYDDGLGPSQTTHSFLATPRK